MDELVKHSLKKVYFCKYDKASCTSWMNLSSTPMYLFCRAMLSRLASASN